MLNTILFTWVKNVYRQCYNWFTNSAVSSPIYSITRSAGSTTDVQLPIYGLFVTNLDDLFYTAKNDNLHLLNNLYTHYPQDLLLRAQKRI